MFALLYSKALVIIVGHLNPLHIFEEELTSNIFKILQAITIVYINFFLVICYKYNNLIKEYLAS